MAVSGLLHVCVRVVHGLRGHSVHKRWLDEIGGVQGGVLGWLAPQPVTAIA